MEENNVELIWLDTVPLHSHKRHNIRTVEGILNEELPAYFRVLLNPT